MEVGHKILANSLSKMTGWTGHNWVRHLPTTLRADRATTKASTGASIFPLLRGESMTFPIELEDPTRSTLPWQKLGEFDGDLAREYDVLRLLYLYKDLDGENSDTLPRTDLSIHRIKLLPEAKPVNRANQRQ